MLSSHDAPGSPRRPAGGALPPVAARHDRRCRVAAAAASLRPQMPKRAPAPVPAPCPYAGVEIIGRARRGRAALPRGRRGRPAGGRVRGRPAQLCGAEVQQRRAPSRASGAPTGAGTASSGRSAGSPPTPPGTSTSSTRATTGSRSSTRAANFITAWGRRGSALGQFNFGSSQNYTQPPGGGIAVAGNYVYVADSGNDRIERFNLEGGEPLQWGSLRPRARTVLLPARCRGQRR